MRDTDCAQIAAAPRRLRFALGIAGIVVLLVSAIGIYFSSVRSDKGGEGAQAGGPAKEPLFRESSEPRPVPAIRFQDEAGRSVSPADFRGKVVLLNVWATWCVPCREEMPALDRLQARLGGPDFEVVALSIDRDGLPAVRRFYSEVGIRALKPYLDPSTEASGKLAVVGIPTTILVNRAGEELGRRAGPAAWDGPQAVEFIRRRIEARGVR